MTNIVRQFNSFSYHDHSLEYCHLTQKLTAAPFSTLVELCTIIFSPKFLRAIINYYVPPQPRHPHLHSLFLEFCPPPYHIPILVPEPTPDPNRHTNMATPQREAYQLPSQRDSSIAGSGAQQQNSTGAAYTPSYGGGVTDSSVSSSVTYVCGECASKVALNLGDAIRCKECGHRVLYKERTKR
jgi:DNA-directed RNA polymerases I, II, and III subunit RPABC4